MSRLESKLSEKASDMTYDSLPGNDDGAYANFAFMDDEEEINTASEDERPVDPPKVTNSVRQFSDDAEAEEARDTIAPIIPASRPVGLRSFLRSPSPVKTSNRISAPPTMDTGRSSVEIPPREDIPEGNPSFIDEEYGESQFDFYISYLRGIDDDLAFALAEIIEKNASSPDGDSCIPFLDRTCLRSMYLEAMKKWRKKAGINRVNGLRNASCIIYLLTPEALVSLKKSGQQEDSLLFELEFGLFGSKPVVPIFVGSQGRMPPKPNPQKYDDAPAFHPWCKMTVRQVMQCLVDKASSGSLMMEKRFKGSGEAEETVKGLEAVLSGASLPKQANPPMFDTSGAPEPDLAEIEARLKSSSKSGGSQAPEDQQLEEEEVDLSIDDHWELERETVDIGDKIGSGEFGDVCEGILHGTGEHKGMKAKVAIKTLKKGSREEFLLEARMMILVKHRNLVNIYGVCTKDEPVLILSELCEKGSVKQFLRTSDGRKSQLGDLLRMVGEVAAGMRHVEESRIVHRDLAARNVLVEVRGKDEYRLKVADFGLAVELPENGQIYQGDIHKPVPIKWTAPEAIRRGKFSTKSDVWSYGITSYEIMTFGSDPYESATNQEVVNHVCDDNVRLPCPSERKARRGCPEKLHAIWLKCWEFAPDDRPSFAELVDDLLPPILGIEF